MLKVHTLLLYIYITDYKLAYILPSTTFFYLSETTTTTTTTTTAITSEINQFNLFCQQCWYLLMVNMLPLLQIEDAEDLAHVNKDSYFQQFMWRNKAPNCEFHI